MDLRRSQVLRPFPTPGSGTLWVAGVSLRDRRVSCLPRWTMCPTRNPSLDTNRSTCRGECSWSGPLVTPPGRCHLGPLTNGPGRIPPYCVCSGGADTVTGGGPQTPEAGPLASVLCGPLSPRPPPFRRVGPCPPAFYPWVSPFPRSFMLFQAPAVSCMPPAFSLRPSPLWHFACHFPGRVQAAFNPHHLPPESPSGPVFAPVSPPPLLPPLFSVPSLPSSPSCGGGGGGARVVVPSGVCTLRAQCKHVAWHLSAGGGATPFLFALPFLAAPLATVPLILALWGGGGLCCVAPFGALRALCPRLWRQACCTHLASTFHHHPVTFMFAGCWCRVRCPFPLGLHVAGTMRARGAALVRRGGGAAPFPSAPPFGAAPLAVVPLVLSLWGGEFASSLVSLPFMPRAPAAGSKHDARTIQQQKSINHFSRWLLQRFPVHVAVVARSILCL